jgi:serine/threonine-protein kinase RsbW
VKTVNIETDADTDALNNISAFVGKTLSGWQVPAISANKIGSAIDEAVTNVILYAYPDRKGKVKVTLEKSEGCIVIKVEDEGVPFDPTQYPAPNTSAPIEEREIGGLGILLVRKMADYVSYARAGDKNHLTFKINFGGVYE